MRPVLRWLVVCLLVASEFFFPGAAAASSVSQSDLAYNPQSCRPFPDNVLYLQRQTIFALGTGDFNSDGIVDLVVNDDYGLSILAGRGNGRFRKEQNFDNGNAQGTVAVGDFNQDDILDVAVASTLGSINVLLGNGDGTFQPPIESVAHQWTRRVVAGDFNGDGKLDAAALSFNDSVVQVLLGRGDGSFQLPLEYLGGYDQKSLATADLNGDGHLDLVVTNSDPFESVASVLFGNGDGTFQPKVDYPTGREPWAVVAGDLNDDGKPDLATADWEGGTASVLLNNGDGTFAPAESYFAGGPLSPEGIVAIRFAKGDRVGLAVTGKAGTFILVNNGNGTFQPAMGYNPAAGGPVVGDFDRDGRADMAEVNFDDGIAVLFGKGDGFFRTSNAYSWKPYVNAVAAGDLNGDGKPDLAVTNRDFHSVGIMLGEGGGRFSKVVHQYRTGGYPQAIAVGDLNGDRKRDLAVALDRQLLVLLGKGDGTYTEKGKFPTQGDYSDSIVLADLDKDGILDALITAYYVYESPSAVNVLLGKGDGTFGAAVPYAVGENPGSIVVADFNRDGNLDFVIGDHSGSAKPSDLALSVFLGNGDGTFGKPVRVPVMAFPYSIASADFNGDGKLDLAVEVGSASVEIELGNGDGSFRHFSIFAAGYEVVAADFNGDGKADLVVVNRDNLAQLFLGKGDGTFRKDSASYVGYGGYSFTFTPFALTDLNHDHAPDLLLPSYWGGAVTVLLNQCSK